MKLLFSWIKQKEKLVPVCQLAEHHHLHPLTGYLNDPMGGLGYFRFLDKSLSILRDKRIQNADISSNSWGVEINDDTVFFYFLFAQEDKDLQFSLSRNVLIDVLALWLIFLSKEKIEGYQELLELPPQ